MKMNGIKKVTAFGMVALQLTGFAFADVGPANQVDDSQELILLSNLVSLSAQKIAQGDIQSKVIPLVNEYEQNASVEGRSDRIAQAAVELNVMRPEKAAQIKASIDETVGSQLKANPNMSEDQRNQLIMQATLQQMNLSDQGAEFSACTALWLGGAGVVVGSVFANVYASTLTHSTSQTTSTGSEQGSGTSTSSSSGTSSSSTTTTVSGSTTTTQSSVTQNSTEKKLLITSAAIGYGIAATMFILAMVEDGNGSCD